MERLGLISPKSGINMIGLLLRVGFFVANLFTFLMFRLYLKKTLVYDSKVCINRNLFGDKCNY